MSRIEETRDDRFARLSAAAEACNATDDQIVAVAREMLASSDHLTDEQFSDLWALVWGVAYEHSNESRELTDRLFAECDAASEASEGQRLRPQHKLDRDIQFE